MCDVSALPTEHSKILVYELLQKKGIRNVECIVTAGSKKGDNFVGEIKRIKVISKSDGRELFSFIMKYTPKEKFKMFNMDVVYDREALMYRVILPMFISIQKEFNVPEGEMFNFVKCYKADNHMLLMDDLCVDGFKMHNVIDSFDSNHLEIVLKNLAKYHSLSFALKEYYPDVHGDYVKLIEINHGEVPITNNIKNLIGPVLENIDESLKDKLKIFCQDTTGMYKRLSSPDTADPYNVICHADCWNNNIMFKYKNGIPIDLRFIDWQIVRYSSPITDLAFVVYINTDVNIRREYGMKIFDVYYDYLAEHLKYFKLEMERCYPRNIFEEHLTRFLPYGLLLAIMIIPVVLSEKEESDDEDSQRLSKKMNFGKGAIDRMNGLVGEFVEMKLI